jgi:hypothetical protein
LDVRDDAGVTAPDQAVETPVFETVPSSAPNTKNTARVEVAQATGDASAEAVDKSTVSAANCRQAAARRPVKQKTTVQAPPRKPASGTFWDALMPRAR